MRQKINVGASRRRVMRTLIAFLAAALVPSVIAAIATPLAPTPDIPGTIGLVPVFLFFSALPTIVFGLPMYLLLHHFRLVRFWSTSGVGFCIGALMAVMTRSPGTAREREILIMAATGAVSGLVFWLVWRPGHATSTPK